METKPVQDFERPAYPTRREVLAGAASFALLSLAGFNFAFAESEVGKISVAPIFNHGDGRGATGCVAVSPPVFLSEEEALQIVKEELAKHGVKLTAGPVLKDLKIAPRETQQIGDDEKTKKVVVDEENAAPLHVTGMDDKKSIAVEFVGYDNYRKLGGVSPYEITKVDREGHLTGSSGCSVSVYNFKEAAEYVAAEAKKQGKDRVFLGVFYDPLPIPPKPQPHKKDETVDRKAEREKREKQLKEQSEKDLRQQAKDFAAWLKEQKAI
jgi:hypothetical protein